MARRTSHNRNNHNDQYNSQHSRPSRNQLSYGDDTSAYDDEFSSPRSAKPQSGSQRRTSTHSEDDDRNYWEQNIQREFRPDRNQLGYGADSSAYDDEFWSSRSDQYQSGRQRRTSTRSEDDDRNYWEQNNQQRFRPSRNQLGYGDDTSAYDDDFLSNGRQSRPSHHRNASSRSMDEDINYWSDQNFGRGQFNDDRGARRNNVGYENVRPDDRYSDGRRHVRDDRQPRNVHPDDIDYVRYPDGGPGRGGESRRSRWFEDESFYEYRESRHDPNARRSARYDMEHQDINYFDRRDSDWNAESQGRRRNITNDNYRGQEQRNQGRPHPQDRWFDYDEQCRPSRDSREERNRNRRR